MKKLPTALLFESGFEDCNKSSPVLFLVDVESLLSEVDAPNDLRVHLRHMLAAILSFELWLDLVDAPPSS